MNNVVIATNLATATTAFSFKLKFNTSNRELIDLMG